MSTDVKVAPVGVNNAGVSSPGSPMMDYMSDVSMFDGFASDYGSSPFGVMGMLNQTRQLDAITGQAGADFHKYDTANILQEDMQTIEPLADSLHQYRDPIWGKRLPIEKDRVNKLLNIENDKAGDHKVAALYKVYCAKYGGLKNEKGPITFENLKDPGLLVKQSKKFLAITAPQAHTKTIAKLTQVAVDSYNPQLAAVLLKEMSEGIGVDDKTVKAIFVDSKEKMDDATHKRFITDVDLAYRKMYHGHSLDHYIHSQYPGIDILGLGIIKTSIFGTNHKGHEYQTILDEARQTTHHVSNPMAVLEMSGIM